MFNFLSAGLKSTEHPAALKAHLQLNLGAPLEDLFSRPKKEVRSQFVELGFQLVRGTLPVLVAEQRACQACAQAMESLHTGSLIIDDIQDRSTWRRGGPSLHLKYGMPVALNAGNWLYFHAFQNIREGTEHPLLRLQLYELMEQVLREAHLGQALDVGNNASQLSPSDMIEISKASLELKSGALMALALLMGATVAQTLKNEEPKQNSGIQQNSDIHQDSCIHQNSEPERSSNSELTAESKELFRKIKKFGTDFGVSLQMFDDLGNVRVDRPTLKHLEDLTLRRPSYIWWTLASTFPERLSDFCGAIDQLPETQALSDFLEQTPVLKVGFESALAFQTQALEFLKKELQPVSELEDKFLQLAKKVAHAYK